MGGSLPTGATRPRGRHQRVKGAAARRDLVYVPKAVCSLHCMHFVYLGSDRAQFSRVGWGVRQAEMVFISHQTCLQAGSGDACRPVGVRGGVHAVSDAMGNVLGGGLIRRAM